MRNNQLKTTESSVTPDRESAVASRAEAFSEKQLQAAILGLAAEKKTDRATKALVDSLDSMKASKLNVKEKLNNLTFLSRVIQAAGGSKYGHAKLRSKVQSIKNYTKGIDIPAGGFVELGCGAHDPISMSTFFFLNGWSPACGVDLLPPRTSYFTALSMYDILANVKMFPGRYVWGANKPSDVLARLRTINVAAFENGDFEAGVASFEGAVRPIAHDFLTCDIQPASVGLLCSFAVLEHVDDIDAIMRRTYELLVPGGIVYHFVDLADHRSYRGDGAFGPLSFLTEDDAPANMNRLRAPEVTNACVAAGFELLKDERSRAPLPPSLKSKLVPRFAAMPDEDVSVFKQQLVLRKPR